MWPQAKLAGLKLHVATLCGIELIMCDLTWSNIVMNEACN